MKSILTVLSLLATFHSRMVCTGQCQIPSDYHGDWYSMEMGRDQLTVVLSTSWGDNFVCREIQNHTNTDSGVEGVSATMLLEKTGSGSSACFMCVDVLYRTPNIIQVRKSSCYTNNAGLSNMCPGSNTLPTATEVTTYFRQNVRTVNCRTTLEGLYQFTYELSWGGGGVCDNPYSQIRAVQDPGSQYIDNEVFSMSYLACPGVAASFSKDVRYQCMGTWFAVIGQTGYTFAAVADVVERDQRERFKCLLTVKNHVSNDNSTRWVMSRFADCSSLNSLYDAPIRLVLRPIEQLLVGKEAVITQNLTQQVVKDGTAVDFVAMVTGTEPLDITWIKDDVPIFPTRGRSMTYDNGTCRLHIAEVFPDDSGTYKLSVENIWNWDEASSTATLQVTDNPGLTLRGPTFFQEPADTTIMPSPTSAVHLYCVADGRPRLSYSWLKGDGNNMTELQTGLYSRFTLGQGRLTINNPDVSEEGLYQCRANNTIGTALSSPVRLSFGRLGQFSNIPPATVTATVGQGAVIECPFIDAFPAASYQWFKQTSSQGLPVFIRPELQLHSFISSNGKLFFSELTMSDDAQYFCIVALVSIARNHIGSPGAIQTRTSLGIRLSVRQAAMDYQAPMIHDDFPLVFPKVPLRGQTIQMECLAYGTLPLTYAWFRDGEEMPHTANFSTDGRVMTLTDVQTKDSGQYRCRVENSRASSDEKNFTLDVQAAPFFSDPLRDQTKEKGSSVVWSCQGQGKPVPMIALYQDGQRRTNFSDDPVDWQVTFTVQEEDSGMYQCVARNGHGQTFSSPAQLKVVDAMTTERTTTTDQTTGSSGLQSSIATVFFALLMSQYSSLFCADRY